MMDFLGTVISYTPNPFMMTMTDGMCCTRTASRCRPQPRVHHAPAHKQP